MSSKGVPDPLDHLRKLKRRQEMMRPGSAEAISAGEKVEILEKTLSVFRAEVDMKFKIMQEILQTRNEQVSVQRKLLEREQTLYKTLLHHWRNTSSLAATGLTMNFSTEEDNENIESNIHGDYLYEEEDGVSRINDPVDAAGSGSNFQSKTKPSRSSLRRKRKSASTFSNLAENKPSGDPLSPSEGESDGNEDEPWSSSMECDMKTVAVGLINKRSNMHSGSGSNASENEDTLGITDVDDPPNPRKQKLGTKGKNSSGSGRKKDPIWDKFEKEPITEGQGRPKYKCKSCRRGKLSAEARRLRHHYLITCPARQTYGVELHDARTPTSASQFLPESVIETFPESGPSRAMFTWSE